MPSTVPIDNPKDRRIALSTKHFTHQVNRTFRESRPFLLILLVDQLLLKMQSGSDRLVRESPNAQVYQAVIRSYFANALSRLRITTACRETTRSFDLAGNRIPTRRHGVRDADVASGAVVVSA
jgi:hypothetical protein